MPHLSNCLEFARKLARGGFTLPESVENRLIRLSRDKERMLNKRKASDRNEIAAAQSVVQSFLDVTREDIAKVIEDLRGQQEAEVMPTKITEDTKKKAETPTQAVAKVAEEVQSVAKTEGQRDAAEVKKELIERLEKSIEDAPSEESAGSEWKALKARLSEAGRKLMAASANADHEAAKAEGDKVLEDIKALAGDELPPGLRSSPWSDYLGGWLARQAEKAKGTVTIEIPGDGTFTVLNTKENLRELLTKAKKLPTKFGPDKPGSEPAQGSARTTANFLTDDTLRGFVINAINGDAWAQKVIAAYRAKGEEFAKTASDLEKGIRADIKAEPTPEKPAASEGALKSPPSGDGQDASEAAYEKAIDSIAAGAYDMSRPVPVGGTPEALRLAGADDLPVTMPPSLVKKVTREVHDIPLDVVRQIARAIKSPVFVFQSATVPDALTVLLDLKHNGESVLVAVHLNRKEQLHEVNAIRSVYDKSNPRAVEGWVKAGLLRYLHQQKGRDWFRSRGLQLPKEGTPRGNPNLRTDADLVNGNLHSAPSSSESDESEIVAALERLYAQSGGIPEPTEEELAALAEFYAIAGKEMPSDATPNAAPAEAPPPAQTSLKNAVVDEERAARGEPPLVRPIVQSWGEAGAAAQRLLEADPLAGRRLLDGLKEHPRALKDEENALLLLYKVNVRHDLRKASHIVNTTQPFTEENREAKARYDQLLNEQNDIDVYGKRAGTESGRSLAARKMMRDEDMSAESLMQRYRTEVNLGEALTEEQKQIVTKYAEKIQKAQAELDRINEELLKKRAEEGLQALAVDVAKKARSKQTPVRKFLDEKARDARARLAGVFGPKLGSVPSGGQLRVKWGDNLGNQKAGVVVGENKVFWKVRADDDGKEWNVRKDRVVIDRSGRALQSAPSGLTAENLADFATVGAAYIEDGATDLPAFTKALTKEFGDKAAPHAGEIYEAAKKAHAKALADLAAASEPSGIVKTARERLRDNPSGDLDQRLLVDLATAYIRRGVSTAEEMVTRITQDIQPIYPDATESNVRTVLSGYGRVPKETKSEVLRKLSEYKSQILKIEQLHVARSGNWPVVTGKHSPKSMRIRKLTAELHDAMKRLGIQTTGEGQLKSARLRVIARLNHQIEDLNGIIAGKVRPRDPQAVVYYDAEMTALLKQRNELKAYVDDLTGPSPELKWNQRAQAAARTSEEYYRRRIAAADFAAKKAPQQVESEATKRLRADAAKAKEEFNRLREATGIPQAEQLAATKAKIEQEIAKAQQRLITGEKPLAGQKKATPAELVALKTTLTRLRQAIQLVERRGKTDTERAEMAAKGLKRTIEDLERRIKQRDTKPKDKQAPVETPELKELRQTRDFLREVYASVREAANPRRLPEEIALQNFRKRIEKLRTEAEQKLHAKEYLEVPKPDPLWQSRKDAAAYQLAKEKEAWARELFEKTMAKRSTIKKILGVGGESINFARAIMTSLDLSAVLRQGGFIALGNPWRGLKSFPAMLKAFVSEKAQFATMEEIKRRPNYPLYLQSKLYLADLGDIDLSKVEEQYMSRWAEGLRGWKGALAGAALGGTAGSLMAGVGAVPGAAFGAVSGALGFVPASQRAYVTFLNKLRADSFDTMMATLGRDERVTKDEGLALANFINVATGRGVLGSSRKPQGNSPVATAVFFSPRLTVSRFNLLLQPLSLLVGQAPFQGNARTTGRIAMEYGKFIAGTAIAMALAGLMKDKDDKEPFIVLDPRSSDFLKLRFRNTRVDLLAGLQQVTTLLTRTILGETIDGKGEVKPARNFGRPLDSMRTEPLGRVEYGKSDGLTITGRFARSKFSPVAGAVADFLSSKDFKGDDVTAEDKAAQFIAPMLLQNQKELLEDQGVPMATVMNLFQLFGAGVQTYTTKKDEKPKHPVKTDLEKFEAKVKKLAPKGAEPSTNIKMPDWMRRLAPATGQKSAANAVIPAGAWRERFKSVALS